MLEVTRYMADDGTVFQHRADAIKRDQELTGLHKIALILTKRRPENLQGWIQHPLPQALLFKAALFEEAAKRHPEHVWKKLVPEDRVYPGTMLSRFIDEAGGPFCKLWWRGRTIDEDGREWMQTWNRVNVEESLKKYPLPADGETP